MSDARPKLVSAAEVRSASLRADALILARRGLSQRAIATTLGISQATVSRWLA